MPIDVTCQCGKRLKAKDELAGRTVKCPACQQPLKIARPQPAAPDPSGAFADLFDEVGMAASSGPTCPSCNAGIAEGAILCIQCGFNLETGKHTRTNIATGGAAPSTGVGHGGEHGGSEAEAILAKAAASDDVEQDLDDRDRYGSMGMAWLLGLIMVACLGGALGGIYYYNVVYLPANPPEEETEDEYN